MKLHMPVICKCGFNTMDAKEAVEHALKHKKEEELEEDLKQWNRLEDNEE